MREEGEPLAVAYINAQRETAQSSLAVKDMSEENSRRHTLEFVCLMPYAHGVTLSVRYSMYPLAGQGFRRAVVNDAVPAFALRPHLAVSQGGLPRPPFSGLRQPFASRALSLPPLGQGRPMQAQQPHSMQLPSSTPLLQPNSRGCWRLTTWGGRAGRAAAASSGRSRVLALQRPHRLLHLHLRHSAIGVPVAQQLLLQ